MKLGQRGLERVHNGIILLSLSIFFFFGRFDGKVFLHDSYGMAGVCIQISEVLLVYIYLGLPPCCG